MKRIGLIVLILAAVFGLIQLIPYGKNHDNPPVVTRIQWDSTQTENLVKMACFDCHSNETNWPWYSNIAPASWLVYHDVEEARTYLNFSDLGPNGYAPMLDRIKQVIMDGKMPPFQYTIIHGSLSTEQKQQLVDGLTASVK